MKRFEDLDFFLSNDIIQGESIPFYLTWKGDNPKKLILQYDGFQSIIELYNAKRSDIIQECNQVVITDFGIPNYLGGLISTRVSNLPVEIGTVNLTVVNADNNTIVFKKSRNIYTTILKVSHIPDELYWDGKDIKNKVCIELRGETTIHIDVVELDENECRIDLPPDIKEMLYNITKCINEGLNSLKEKFPQYVETIDLFLSLSSEKLSFSQYLEKIDDNIKNSLADEIFSEELINIAILAIFEQTSLNDRLVRPWREYLEYHSADKAFFSNPMLTLEIPNNKSILAVKLKIKDLLNQECGEPLVIKVPVSPSLEGSGVQIPLKDIFSIRRVKV